MLVYHITSIANLEDILKSGYIHCNTYMSEHNISYINIAHANIKDIRMSMPIVVNDEQRGNVGDYVPFYFCNRSPMLYALHTGYVGDCKTNQSEILHLCFDTEELIKANRIWCYSDGNAAAGYTNFFNDKEFKNIDFNIIESSSWHNTDNDMDRKRKKQAEFLVKNKVDMGLLCKIGTHNEDTKSAVEAIFSNAKQNITVKVERSWYY